MAETEFKTIRQKTEKLLSQSEGSDVDFKEEIGGIEPDDLIAFANSPDGGFLLVGVAETEGEQGQQRGEVVGCDISDSGEQRIMGQARSCTPTVPLDIYVENTNRTPFLRVDIPQGPDRPYCTDSGKYRIREDGRTRALHPPELLNLFVQEQADRFRERFESAASGLEAEIESLRVRLEGRIENFLAEIQSQLGEVQLISSRISDLEHEMSNTLRDIFSHAEEAQEMSESANFWAEDAHLSAEQAASNTEEVPDISQNVMHLAWKLNALLNHFDIEDPEITREREKVRRSTKKIVELAIGSRDMDEEDLRGFYEDQKEHIEHDLNLHKPFEEYVSFEDVLEWYNQGGDEVESEHYGIEALDDEIDEAT
jgi:predicted HTH transcriptional regulator